VVIGAAVEHAGIPASEIENKGIGESMQGGGNIGRNAAVRLGMIVVGVGGGTESMSTAPGTSKPGPDGAPAFWLSPGNPDTPDAPPFNMALTVGDNTAHLAGVTREETDEWAFESHRRAIRAIDEGRFDAEIVPVDLPGGRQSTTDEHPRRNSSLEKLATLGLLNAGLDDAVTTAGNSSGLNDAAAALVLCSRAYAEAHGLTPLAAIRGWASIGLDPVETGLAPAKALPKAGISLADLQSVATNEAFASTAVASTRIMGLDHDLVNVNGSGCSLGHPIACTGARMILTMVNELIRADAQWGSVAMCAAGDMGSATVIERL